jgi:hypothetical protein
LQPRLPFVRRLAVFGWVLSVGNRTQLRFVGFYTEYSHSSHTNIKLRFYIQSKFIKFNFQQIMRYLINSET